MQCPWCRGRYAPPAERCPTCGRPLGPWLEPGMLVSGRYEVQSALGCGGMGIVYRALDRVVEEAIALKVLVGGAPEAELDLRLRREIRLARRVTHENVCRIHECGEDRELRYVSMELIEGEDLKRRVRRAPLAADEAFSMSLQALAGLEAVHRAGIIHRDVKTANLMIDRRGVVKVMDFGIAKPADGSGPAGPTRTGEIVGSPEYMSPEQARGERLDARSDVYSMGIVIFELFVGQVPFHADSPLATVLQHLNTPPPLDGLAAQRLPGAMRPVLRAALAKAREERPSAAAVLAEEIRRARGVPEPEPSSRTWTIATPTPPVSEQPTRAAQPATSGDDGPPGEAAPQGRGTTRRARARAGAVLAAALTLFGLGLAAWRGIRPRPPLEGTPGDRPESTSSPPTRPPSPSAPIRLETPRSPERSRVSRGRTDAPAPPSPAAAPTPAPGPEPPAAETPEPASVPIGTDVVVSITSEIRSDRTRPGATFAARLAEPLLAEGREIARPGALVGGRVTGAGVRPGSPPLPFLELCLVSVEVEGRAVPIRTGLYHLVAPPPERGAPSLAAVVIGSAAGALLGAVVGGRSGAATGAMAGAATAAAGAPSTTNPQEYRFGDRLTFRLAEPFAVSTAGQPRSLP